MTTQVTYTADGATAVFPFPFAIATEADCRVLVNDILQTGGYSIRGRASIDGGAVVFDSAPAAGVSVSIRYRGLVTVTPADAGRGHLADKLMAGANVTLETVTEPEGVQRLRISTTNLDALEKSANLSDLADVGAARENLGVYSTSQTNEAIATAVAGAIATALQKAQNLADLADKATARANLGVYSVTEADSAMQSVRDQLALTNLRLLLVSSVSSGALVQGRQWELGSDEWASGSSGYSFVLGSPNSYMAIGSGKQVFNYSGSDQTFTVPAGVTSVTVKLWGAGGAGYSSNCHGGGAGCTTGVLAVTPGETLTVMVGQGGEGPTTAAQSTVMYGGGGIGGTVFASAGYNCCGGGRSAILRNGTEVAVAGGGGGGTASNGGYFSGVGGVGGGTSGGAGTSTNASYYGPDGCYGKGGTQSSGGAAGASGVNGSTAGGRGVGGTGITAYYNGGGGGGGGYYGGGGGLGGGGGGGGYTGGLTSASIVSGSGYTPAGIGDADYAANIGVGGQGGNGGNGLVVVSWDVAQNMTLVSPVVSLSTSPSFTDTYFLWKDDSGSAVLGDDLTVEHSRDGGTTWTAASLAMVAAYDGTYATIRARADVSGQPTGTSLRTRIRTFNNKVQRVAAPALYKE